MKPRLLLAALLAVWINFLIVGLAGAQDAGPAEPSLSESIRRLVGKYETTRKSRVGLAVVDLRNARIVFTHNESDAFIPASNQKLLTSAFALARLGVDFKFRTAVYQAGNSLVVAGDFDPTLGDPVLAKRQNASIYAEMDKWAQAVREKVGEKIDGDLILRVKLPQEHNRPPHWKASHYEKWYGAAVGELNFHNNCFDVTFKGGKDGAIFPHLAPASRFIQIIDRTRRGRRQLWRLRLSDDESQVTVLGQIKTASPYPVSTPVSNPTMLFGRVFADRLAKAGVTIDGKIRCIDASQMDLSNATMIAETATPLSLALDRANKRSLNMAAECIFLRAGDGSWAGSAKLMLQTLAEKFGIDVANLEIADGCGLGRDNKVSPKSISALLAAMAVGKYAELFLPTLARNGVDGTLKRRIKDKRWQGRVAGKTGYVAGVVALSGYVMDEADKPVYAFSCLINKVRSISDARRLQDNICKALIKKASPTQ